MKQLQQLKEAARENFEPVFALLDKGDKYIRNSDYDIGLSSRMLTEKKLDEIVTSTYLQAVEATTIEEHKPRLELWNEAVEEGRRRERGFIMSLIDGRKVVYKEGDERFYEDSEDGEEKDHIDSCCNETLDEILQSLKQADK